MALPSAPLHTLAAMDTGDLRARARALTEEADLLAAVVKGRRAEAARLRAQADRLDHGTGVVVSHARTRDPLMAAAGVAVEDLAPGFTARDLAAALGIADVARATRLLAALAHFGKVAQLAEGWAVVDGDVRPALAAVG